VQAWLGGRRSLAVALMTLTLLLTLVVPLTLGITAIVGSSGEIAGWTKSLATLTVPPPPAWVAGLPAVGGKLAAQWQEFAAAGPGELVARLSPYVQPVALWFAGQVGSIGLMLVEFLLSVIIAAILYKNGEKAALTANRLARRLAGPQGENAVQLAAQAVRAVAMGIVVTAIVQSALGAIGLAIAGVPFTVFLTGLIFILSVAQVGAGPVLIPAVIWVYFRSGGVWGTVFLLWAIFCMTSDNLLRPMLIKRGADLPLLLIFSGVIGGLAAFGVIGIFIGPMVLAVVYTLLADWVSEGESSAGQGPAPATTRKA
jgi:predicted PurR-regulated permease PerM